MSLLGACVGISGIRSLFDPFASAPKSLSATKTSVVFIGIAIWGLSEVVLGTVGILKCKIWKFLFSSLEILIGEVLFLSIAENKAHSF